MNKTLLNYDPAAALDSSEAIAVFMTDALETGDAAYIEKAMEVVARAKGMAGLDVNTATFDDIAMNVTPNPNCFCE